VKNKNKKTRLHCTGADGIALRLFISLISFTRKMKIFPGLRTAVIS
jgi:hypothetical protein